MCYYRLQTPAVSLSPLSPRLTLPNISQNIITGELQEERLSVNKALSVCFQTGCLTLDDTRRWVGPWGGGRTTGKKRPWAAWNTKDKEEE